MSKQSHDGRRHNYQLPLMSPQFANRFFSSSSLEVHTLLPYRRHGRIHSDGNGSFLPQLY